jgi:hypothetical protein
LHVKHIDCKDTPIIFLICKCDELKHFQATLTSGINGDNGNEYKALCGVNYDIAICSEAHTVAKNLIV